MAYKSKEEMREYQRKYREAHPDYHKEYQRKYRKEHREEIRRKSKEYYMLGALKKRLKEEEKAQKELKEQIEKDRTEQALTKLKDYNIELESMKKSCTVILHTKFRPDKALDELNSKRINAHERSIEGQLKRLIGKNLIYIVELNKKNISLIHRELYINKCQLGDLMDLPEEVFKIITNFEYYAKE